MAVVLFTLSPQHHTTRSWLKTVIEMSAVEPEEVPLRGDAADVAAVNLLSAWLAQAENGPPPAGVTYAAVIVAGSSVLCTCDAAAAALASGAAPLAVLSGGWGHSTPLLRAALVRRLGGEAALAAHRFVGPDGEASRVPFFRWLAQTVPPEAITFRTTDMRAMSQAVIDGAGIGFLPVWVAQGQADLVEVLPPRKEWEVEVWLVTHVDLHRTAKVQGFLAYLKQEAKSWPMA